MGKFKEGQNREQVTFLPPSIEEYVASDDGVRLIDELVEQLDLSSIENCYSEQGCRGYSPRILVKILIYGKIEGIRSSRKLANACQDSLRFIFLCRGEQPNFRTISDFRKKHIVSLGSILKQTVELGICEGVITLSHVAVDGTKVRANASLKSYRKPEKLQELLKELEESLHEDVHLDEDEDNKHGDDGDGGMRLPKKLEDRKKLRDKIQSVLSAQEEGEMPAQISTSDPQARIMKGPEGKRSSYNAQGAMDQDGMMFVGAYVTNAGSDHGEIRRLLEEIESTTDNNPEKLTADRGYRKTDGLVALEERGIEGFIPLPERSHKKEISQEQFLYDEDNDEYLCPEGRFLSLKTQRKNADEYQSEDCSGCSRSKGCLTNPDSQRVIKVSHFADAIQRMQERTSLERGKSMSRRRSQTIELGFAWIKTHKKFRQFIFRTLKEVSAEWKFECAAINLWRLANLRHQARQATA
jgi:transposase